MPDISHNEAGINPPTGLEDLTPKEKVALAAAFGHPVRDYRWVREDGTIGKKPVGMAWQANKPTAEEWLVHFMAPVPQRLRPEVPPDAVPGIGFVPMHDGITVLDNDGADATETLRRFLGAALLGIVPSSSGKQHLVVNGLFPEDRNWAFLDAGGETRCRRGYIAMSDPKAVLELLSKAGGDELPKNRIAELYGRGKAKNGGRHPTLMSKLGAAKSQDEREALWDWWNNTVNKHKNEPDNRAEYDSAVEWFADKPFAAEGGRPTAADAAFANLSYNTRGDYVMVDGRRPKRGTMAGVRMELRDRLAASGKAAGERLLADIIELAATANPVDPAEALWAAEWDGTPRLDGLMENLFIIPEPYLPIARWAGPHTFLSVLHRTRHPGAVIDETLILIGEGGVGKSSFVRGMIPAGLRGELFSNQLNMGGGPKARIEATLGRAVIEWAETSGIRKADLASMKNYLTTQDDAGVRLSYRTDATPLPRMFHIVATANDMGDGVLAVADRRFVPLEVGNGAALVHIIMDSLRDQLWAEAKHRYDQGEEPDFPEEVAAVRDAIIGEHVTTDDVLTERVIDATDGLNAVTLREVADAIYPPRTDREGNSLGPVKLTGYEAQAIARTLKALGWAKGRHRAPGERVVRWFAP